MCRRLRRVALGVARLAVSPSASSDMGEPRGDMKPVFRATSTTTHFVVPFSFVHDTGDGGAPVDASRG